MNNLDTIRLEIFRSLFSAVAEEMGATLMRSASSPNIKERRDYSCAIFTGAGELVAQGEHMPVHLGSMPLSVKSALNEIDIQPGDVAVLNDPYKGGTHLPDITMIAPVYVEKQDNPGFFVASRAHHADVGGMSAGSMPLATEIYQEGQIIPPVKWIAGGEPNQDLQRLLLNNVRTPEERSEDLSAQVASLKVGEKRIGELIDRYGYEEIDSFMHQVMDYSNKLMENELNEMPDGEYSATDYLDDDGISDDQVKIACTITIQNKRATIDFSESSIQVRGSLNAVFAITYSATVYCFRSLAKTKIPVNDGCFRPLKVTAPKGLVVNAAAPAAVAGGNVETSQRIVDVVYKVLARIIPDRVPAASQGTMNNLAIGGTDGDGDPFGYYETLAGGMGARPQKSGISGIHTHMTNTMNTPIEALEIAYPFRVHQYHFHDGSGGNGQYNGGDGLVRSVELLTDAQVTMLSERRKLQPYGLNEGDPGKPGKNILIKGDREQELPSKFSKYLEKGDIIRIQTPGGGGYGGIDE